MWCQICETSSQLRHWMSWVRSEAMEAHQHHLSITDAVIPTYCRLLQFIQLFPYQRNLDATNVSCSNSGYTIGICKWFCGLHVRQKIITSSEFVASLFQMVVMFQTILQLAMLIQWEGKCNACHWITDCVIVDQHQRLVMHLKQTLITGVFRFVELIQMGMVKQMGMNLVCNEYCILPDS